MTRILADLPDDDIRWLDRQAERQNKPRAAVLREAASAYRAEGSTDWIDQAFGVWKDWVDIGDAVEWQRRQRASNTDHGTSTMQRSGQSFQICPTNRMIANTSATSGCCRSRMVV